MSEIIYETDSPKETFELGRKMGEEAYPGMIIAMNGDLGVGKTLFTQGFANGLGITDAVSSPTFTILQVYEKGRIPFYHFDVYRIAEPEEMDEIGFEDYIFGDGVSVIEWAELIDELIPPEAVRIVIEKDLSKGFDHRRIRVTKPDHYL